MMWRADSYLIDRVFQPIADALARVTSCYGLAGFLSVGGILSFVAAQVYVGNYVLAAVLGASWSWVPLCASRLEQRPLTNVMSTIRIVQFPCRCISVYCLIMHSLLTYLIMHIYTVLGCFGWVLLVLAQYFLACQRRPPLRQRARVPIGAVMDAS